MKRRKIASLLITALTVSMLVSGCGNKQNDTEKNSEVVSGTETENVSEMETEEKTESQVSSETESETQVATNDSSEKESEKEDEKESEKKDENKEENKPVEPTKPTHTCDYSALKSDANNHWYACSCGKTTGKGAHNYDNNSDASCNTCGYTRTVHTCNYSTLKTDASNHWYVCSCGATSGKGAHNYDNDSDASCNTCGYTREVKPVEPSVPGSSVNWNGGDIYLDSVGIKIPTLTEFNKTGLESSSSDWWWTGHEDDRAALSAMNRIYYTCDEFFYGLVDNGFDDQSSNAFSVTQGVIWFAWLDGNNRDFCLTRDAKNGYYILEINRDLRSDNLFGVSLERENRDVVKTMLSFITPNVNQVFDYLWNGFYGSGTAFNTSKYESVGDCKIKLDPYFVVDKDNTVHHVKFYIKAN